MKVNRIRQNVFPMLAAFIWGTAFVAQSVGADYVEPFTFNAARSAVAFLFLLALCGVFRAVRRRDPKAETAPGSRKELVIGGVCCGLALTVASNLQQKGLETTTSGKAGFITALYIVIVPIAGIFLGKKAPKVIWVSVVLAVAGLYCLCITEDFTITGGDFYILLCAFCFTAHILVIDHFTQRVDGVAMSCIQFLTAAVLSAAGMLLTESPSLEALRTCAGPILYVGIFSSGRGLYAADPGPEGFQPHGGIPAAEPGIGVCHAVRGRHPGGHHERQGVFRLCADAGGGGPGPAAGAPETADGGSGTEMTKAGRPFSASPLHLGLDKGGPLWYNEKLYEYVARWYHAYRRIRRRL